MHHHTELSFVDEFRWVSPLRHKKTEDRKLFFFGACGKRGRHFYITTASSFCIPASYCQLSATLQITSIIVIDLQDNRAEIRIFIALLMYSFDSPAYIKLNVSERDGCLTTATRITVFWYADYNRATLIYDLCTWSMQVFKVVSAIRYSDTWRHVVWYSDTNVSEKLAACVAFQRTSWSKASSFSWKQKLVKYRCDY